MASEERISTGIPALDEMLGGGLFRGTTTLIRGKFGVGKTIFGVHIAHAGIKDDGYAGLLVDMSRGDVQRHIEYAKKFCKWDLRQWAEKNYDSAQDRKGRNYYQPDYKSPGFSSETPYMDISYDWFYHAHLSSGAKRLIFDGIDPYDTIGPTHSVGPQINKLYPWLQELWKGKVWEKGEYETDVRDLAIVVLETTDEQDLKVMMTKKWEDSTLLSQANTVIYMGNWFENTSLDEVVPSAIAVRKHRGSPFVDYAPRQIILEKNKVRFPHYNGR